MALAYLNNLAYAHGMKEMYCRGYYVGTFGEYDMGAVRRALLLIHRKQVSCRR